MNPAQLTIYKSLLRNKLRYLARQIPPAERRRKSRRIVGRLTKTPIFRRAQNILTYWALPNEVETKGLITEALAMKKNIFLPKVNPRNKELSICGPFPLKQRRGAAVEMDLVTVPGLGFDRRGVRLGRGGGSFDRFLAKAVRAAKIGLAFKEQKVKKIPSGPHDVRMDKVLTD